jgi:hypothetical protein
MKPVLPSSIGAKRPTEECRVAAPAGAKTGPRRAFQWDLARQVESLDWLMAQLPRYANWGYQELYLHLEDAVEYPSLPGVARRGAYSHRELGRLVAAAGRAGIGVVPIVNLLGHTQYLLKVPALRDLNELRAPGGAPLVHGQLCPLHPRTLEIAGKLLGDVAPFCTAGKVHVGLDESYHLGRHPLSRAEIAEVGLAGHFARYVQRLHGLAGGQGLRLGLWADMLALLPAAIPLLPRDVIAYDWYYYPFRRRPRLELRNFAEYDLAAPLRARGIEYWGCPMNGAFRHEPLPIAGERLANIADWWRRCRQTGAAGMLVTSWEPQRLAAELPLTIDAAAAGLWLDGEKAPDRLLAGGCRRVFGPRGAGAARALRAAAAHPFLGYARWQVNDRWDTVLAPERGFPGRDGRPARPGPLYPSPQPRRAGPRVPTLAAWRAEARACVRWAARRGLPPAIAASLRFRSYLAERDLFVRAAGQGIWQARAALAAGRPLRAAGLLAALDQNAASFASALKKGRRAAREMWRRTRDPRSQGPNELAVAADGGRLRAWRAWLKRGRARPARVATSSPMAGAWQLLFRVRNFAPAAQKVVVEQSADGKAWRELHGCFLIEFQARAAAPSARLVQIFSTPVAWPGPPAKLPQLRIAVRGFGQIRLDQVRLTDGVQSYSIRSGPRRRILGRPAPRSGYPDFAWSENRGVWQPTLRSDARSS